MKNKWIIITGASSGIGKATAEELLKSGYSVVVSSRNRKALEKNFLQFNTRVKIIEWDFSDINSIPVYAEKVVNEVGPISGLVHCAGVQR